MYGSGAADGGAGDSAMVVAGRPQLWSGGPQGIGKNGLVVGKGEGGRTKDIWWGGWG